MKYQLSCYDPVTDELISATELKMTKNELQKLFHLDSYDIENFSSLTVTAAHRQELTKRTKQNISLDEFCYVVEATSDDDPFADLNVLY